MINTFEKVDADVQELKTTYGRDNTKQAKVPLIVVS